MTSIPTVDGRRDGPYVVIRCPWCNHEHTHGAHNPNGTCAYGTQRGTPCTCPIGTGSGHRVAHCHGDNPGYIIRETT